MQLTVESESHLPVYVQLREQIKFLILKGELAPGASLPTTRQLAGYLRVNRNTVLKAYQELERDGLIKCQRGQGCQVAERPTNAAQPISPQLLEVVDRAIEQAGQIGVGPDDFATIVYARARQRRDVQVRRRIVFVECGIHTATALARAIQEKLGVEVTPILLQDLRHPTPETEDRICEAQVVATTFFHVQELRRLLASTRKEIVALVVKPHLEKLIQLAQIPKGTPVALVCIDDCGVLESKESLENAGIKGLDIRLGSLENRQKLAETISQVSLVISSDFVADEVRPLLQPDQEMIALDYTSLDEGAVSLLKSMVLEQTITGRI